MATTYQVRYRKLGTTTWTAYGQPTSNLNQVLAGLQPNTTYQLQILATNELGEVASSIVSVATTARGPSAPPIPIVSAITQSSVVLNWSTSATGSLPIAYQPMFRVHNTGSYAAFGSPLSGQSVTVTGLTPATSYDFEVVSSNSAGSAVSPVATASTLAAGTAPGAATSLNLSNVQQTQVTLGWSASASGSTPISYQPQYRLHGSTAAFTNVPAQPISGISQTITGLTAGTQYDFQVIAQNSVGSTTSSLLTDSTAAAAVAPGVPGTPTVSAITTSGVTLTWTAPSTGTTPFTYQVQFRKSGTTGFANFGAAISGLTEAVTGLTSATGYDFQVLAINSAGSTASATASATTATVATVPSAPTGLAASSITQSGLSLSWTASASGTPPITYTPQFRITGSGSAFSNAAATTTTSQNLTNLTPNTTYDLQVVASNASGSATSSVITAATLVAATTWDPANTTGTEFNLSNNNLTLTSKAATQGGSRSTTSRASSKWYVEVKPTLATGTQRVGFANASASLLSIFGSTADSIGIDPSGNVRIGNVLIGTGAPWVANSVISLALDEVNSKLYYQVSGGGWGAAPAAGESGTQEVGTSGSGPVIDGPASAHLPLSQTLALTGVTVADTVWPHGGTAALNVLCTGGTVSLTLNGAAVAGSGTNTIHVNDTDANVQAMVQTLSYTGPGSGTGDAVTVEVFDQLGQHVMLTIPIRLDSNSDPVNNIGGFSLLTLNAGPYFLAYSDNSNGDSITADFGATPMAFTPPSGFFTWDGLGSAPPQNMAAPSVTGVTSSAATLTWVAPPTGAPPFTYQPLYRVHGAINFVSFGAPTSLLSTTVTGLAAGTNYDFAVTVSNATGSTTSPVTSALTSSATVTPGQVGGAQSSGGNPNIIGPQIGKDLLGQPLYVTGITLSDTTWPTTSNNTLAVSCTNGTVRMQVGGSNVAGSGTKTISYASTPGNLQAAAASLVYTAPASGTADSIVVKLTDQGGASASITVQLTLVPLSSGAPTSDFTVQLGTIGTTSIGLTWTAPSSPASATPTVFDAEFDTFVTHRAWQSPDLWGYCATVSQDGRGGPNFNEGGQQWWVNPLNPSTPINNLYIDSGGILQLGVDNTPSADAAYINGQAGATMPYVATLLNNQNVAFRQFGYYEYKVAVPKIPGFCFQVDLEDFPATPTWNLEIDMSIGTDGSNVQSLILQFQWNAPSFGQQIVYTNTSLDFTQSHTYGLNWQSDFITLYIDGSQVYQTPTNTYGSGIFTTSSMFCYMLTAANYQQAAINPSRSSLPAYAQVDYFRIYATKPAAATGGAISYAVQYRISGTFPWTITSQTTAQAETITGLNLATSYDFQVGASNTAGIGYSNIITGVTNQQTAANPLPGDTTGTTAARIADLMELFGVNTFSSTASNSNTWGTFPSDYSQQSVINGLNFLTAGSGLVCNIREYHYAGKEQWQATWCPAVFNATGALFTMAIGANGSDSDVASMMAMGVSSSTSTGWMRWAEGNNEPNNNFGSGVVPAATTVTVQQDIFTRCQNTNSAKFPVAAVGPSLIFGLPNPETGGPLAGYLNSTQLSQVEAAMSLINVHFYPSANPDVNDNSGRGGEFDDVKLGLNNFWGARPQIITEWHPTLYISDSTKKTAAYDAYYGPLFLLNASRLGYSAAFWYALYDWQDSTQSGYLKVGLWPNNFGQSPRPIANTLAAMYKLTGDLAVAFAGVGGVKDNNGGLWTITSGGIVDLNGAPAGTTANATQVVLGTNGTIYHENSSVQWYSWNGTTWSGPVAAPTIAASSTKRSFTPSKLNYTVSGLPAAPAGAPNTGGQHRLFQNSSGRFFLYVWNEQTALSTTKVNVTVQLPSHTPKRITEYNVSAVGGTSSGTGAFTVRNGQWIAPDGQVFTAAGINIYNNSIGSGNGANDFNIVRSAFPKINMMRIAYQTGWAGNAENDQEYLAFIDAATAARVVCICEDHSTISSWTWTQAQINTYAALATRYKNNPYVWFESFNEPQGPSGSMTDIQLMNAIRAMYDAVRGAGNSNPFLICLPGGAYTDVVTANPNYIAGGATSSYPNSGPGSGGSSIPAMINAGFDFHYYGTTVGNGGTLSSDINVLLNGTSYTFGLHGAGYNWLQTNAPKSSDGTMPVICGEWGPGYDTNHTDNNMIAAVLQQTSPFPYPGFPNLAWNWAAGAPDILTTNNQLTSYGQAVENFANQYGTQVGVPTIGPQTVVQQVSSSSVVIALDTSVHLLAIDY